MMNPTPFKTTHTPNNSDEWELGNDDGFIYKRKKRRLDPTSMPTAPDPVPDPDLEFKERKQRKRAALLKLKERYQREVLQWEHLSNAIKAMEQMPSNIVPECVDDGDVRNPAVDPNENSGRSLLNEVLKKVEAQETMITSLERLCDVAESLCNVQEEKEKQCYLDLPIWSSPSELMASLCED